MHAAVSNPFEKVYANDTTFIITMVAAYSLTPKYPLMRIINSQTHQSNASIIVDGIANLKYPFKSLKILLSGCIKAS